MYQKQYIFLGLLLTLLFVADLVLGSIQIPFSQIFDTFFTGNAPEHIKEILFSFRLPKACTAVLAGAALSVCGVQMQTLFRNPLADPFVLGISSGAGLGVAFFVMGFSAGAMAFGMPLLMNLGIAAAAWIGALTVSFLIMVASKRLKSTMSLLILGLMIGSVGSALIGLFQYFSSATALKMFVLWTMGSFSAVTGSRLVIMAVLVAAGGLISIFNIKPLNVLLMGETYARSLGLKLNNVRNSIFISTALLAGTVTAFCGPIGFIGIAVPHLSRILFGSANHNILLPSSALLGASVMLFADILSQVPGASQTLPINSVSALLGLPIILLIILQNKSKVY